MNARTRLSLVILAAWLGFLLPVAGQSDRREPSSAATQSHLPIQGGGPLRSAGAAEELLDGRLKEQGLVLQKQLEAHKLAGTVLSNPNALKEQLKLTPDQIAELSKKLKAFQAKGVAGGQNPEALRKQADDLMKYLQPLLQPTAEGTLPPTQNQLRDALLQQRLKSAEAAASQLPSPPRIRPSEAKPHAGAKSRPPRPAAPAATEKTDSQLQARLGRQLANWAERMDPGSTLSRNPSWRRMMQGLSRYKQGENLPGDDSFMARWGLGDRVPKLSVLEGWSFRPSLPSSSLPDLSSLLSTSGRTSAGWSASRSGGPGAPAAGLWRGLFWLILVGALGGTLWWVLSGRNPLSVAESGKQAGSTWSAGAWPVQPGEVRTRAQLVQAFEHFSLLVLGRDARSWNHQQIATSLAADDTPEARRQAAVELVGLYECARYAPEAQLMPDTDLARARHHLCFLTGVST